jgi:hypothetical protein
MDSAQADLVDGAFFVAVSDLETRLPRDFSKKFPDTHGSGIGEINQLTRIVSFSSRSNSWLLLQDQQLTFRHGIPSFA